MQGVDSITNSVYNQKINELRERCRLERLRSSARIRGLKDTLFRETARYNNWILEESKRYKESQQSLLLELRLVHEGFRDLVASSSSEIGPGTSGTDGSHHRSRETLNENNGEDSDVEV